MADPTKARIVILSGQETLSDPKSRATYSATAMPSSDKTSENRCETWASTKCCPRRARLGNEHTWSERLVPFGAGALTI